VGSPRWRKKRSMLAGAMTRARSFIRAAAVTRLGVDVEGPLELDHPQREPAAAQPRDRGGVRIDGGGLRTKGSNPHGSHVAGGACNTLTPRHRPPAHSGRGARRRGD
jgi:hypothetical protein